MNRDISAHKYGKGKQALRWGKYLVHLSVLIPLVGVAAIACLVSSFGIIAGPVMVGLYDPEGYSSALAVLVTSSVLAVASGLFLRKYIKAPVGNILHPAPPIENPLLPDEELLVRASSSTEAQPAELLRAATETTQEKPEELLRAETKQ